MKKAFIAAALAAATAIMPAAAQNEPQHRDTLSMNEAYALYGLYENALSLGKKMAARHPSPPLPALNANACYTLVNTGYTTAIANSKYEHSLSLFSPLIRNAQGTVLNREGEEFMPHNYQTNSTERVTAHFTDPAALRAAYKGVVEFPRYVAAGCYDTAPAAEDAALALNTALEKDFLKLGTVKLGEAVRRGLKQAPPKP